MRATTSYRTALVGLAGLLFITVWTGGCGAPAPDEGPVGNGSYEPPPVNVSVVKLEPTELTETEVLTGKIAPWVEVEVSAELGGTVQEIGFEKGQRVKKGQVLARVGTDLLDAALREAQAALEEAEANYNRAKELFARQAVPRQELVTHTSRYHAAQARLEVANLRVQRSVIKAPVSGMAISRHADVGEVVPPGARITSIHQVSRLKVEVGIPENDIAYFRNGGEATLKVDAYPGKIFEGTIHFLGPVANSKTRTFPSEVAITNTGNELRPGMIARVSLVKRRLENAVVVPRDALLDRDLGSVAFVGVEDRAQERQVVLGPSEGNRVVIEDGLSFGESLIVAGHRNLVDGQPIRVVN
jgi:membrane fusion protein (multidrug efflux system)